MCARVVFRFGSKVITVGGAGGKLWMGYVVFLVLVNDFCQQKLACSVILAGYFRQKWDVHGIEWIFMERKDQQFD